MQCLQIDQIHYRVISDEFSKKKFIWTKEGREEGGVDEENDGGFQSDSFPASLLQCMYEAWGRTKSPPLTPSNDKYPA